MCREEKVIWGPVKRFFSLKMENYKPLGSSGSKRQHKTQVLLKFQASQQHKIFWNARKGPSCDCISLKWVSVKKTTSHRGKAKIVNVRGKGWSKVLRFLKSPWSFSALMVLLLYQLEIITKEKEKRNKRIYNYIVSWN